MAEAELLQLYQRAILNRSRDPQYKRAAPEGKRVIRGKNPRCGDDISICIEELSFDGYACSLCTASADLLCATIERLRTQGATTSEIQEQVQRIFELLQKPDDPAWARPDIDELKALLAAHQVPARLDCIYLPWKSIAEADFADE